jgi:putative glycerol-1-phosphate prenyltransferase
MAGEMLGLKLIYLEAGSGAGQSINANTVFQVKKNVSIPVVVGGGIQRADKINALFHAGADIIVVGNAIECDINQLRILSNASKKR